MIEGVRGACNQLSAWLQLLKRVATEEVENRNIENTKTMFMVSSLDSVTKLALLGDDSPHDQTCLVARSRLSPFPSIKPMESASQTRVSERAAEKTCSKSFTERHLNLVTVQKYDGKHVQSLGSQNVRVDSICMWRSQMDNLNTKQKML